MEPSFPSQRTSLDKEEESSPNGHESRYRDIISTLPKDDSWKPLGFHYQYQGFWYFPATFLEGIMSAQEQFEAQPSDILVSSVPKSGTTWLKALTYAIVTRARFDPSTTSPLLTTMPHECIPTVEGDLFHNSTNRDPQLPLVATHIPYTSLPKSIMDSGCKIVYIFRDPKDAFVSLWHFAGRYIAPKDHREEYCPLEEAFKLFCKGMSFYGPYWDHVIGYWKASLEWPGRVLILKYEDVMRDTEFHVKRLAEFMGYGFSLEEEKEGMVQKIINLCSFENLSNLSVNKTGMHRLRSSSLLEIEKSSFFRKGKVGDWKNHLSAEMAEEMDRITDHKFGSVGLR
ncbi:flavonol sulfotransferase-like [Cornus florida]|uniref:flavonol sulfotransferase-like n=1 Tax=Cornus florida TaxID=4283 RepID=UPI00289AA34E|nr:flavonol sulfotransferase-like [Cornus florida]